MKKAPLWLLVMVTISGTLAMHMFVPALPAAATAFAVSPATMQMAIGVYIIGLAVGQLVYGPLSDGLGRRPMLLLGLAIYAVAGAVAATAHSIHVLLAARLFQALGGCAGLALGRAMVRDVSTTVDAVRDLALLNLMMMVGPGLAPLIGSTLSAHFGWRSIFMLLAAMGLITLACCWRLLPETSRPSGQVSLRALASDYRALLRNRAFLGFALGGGCTTTSIYAFIAAAPFLFVEQLQRSPQEVGWYLGALIVGMSVGNALTRRLARNYPLARLLMAGNLLCLASASALLAAECAGALSVAWVLGSMFVFTLGAGLTSPAAMTKALSVDQHLIGSAAGFYGFTQMLVGALCTTAVGWMGSPAMAAAVVLVSAALLGQIGFWLGFGSERRALAAGGVEPSQA
ncbi:multidrug effflux MFS transporter [Pseudomonas typographi]|uniref:multidrug effflux MFS transporter n=1 Tax=Pseudomonas typographi TaxID=2715964 RepID=UPI001EEEE581|nr:multidrug effflux MFS transporter [Pseudomonas typographi]